MVYKLTADEDIRYRLMSSYPQDGFFLEEGDSINIIGSVLKYLKVRSAKEKRKGKYRLEAIE